METNMTLRQESPMLSTLRRKRRAKIVEDSVTSAVSVKVGEGPQSKDCSPPLGTSMWTT
jgi:hypothetical protein